MSKDIETKISRGLADMVPADTFDKISSKLESVSIEERTYVTMKKKNNIFKILLPVAACLILAIGLFGYFHYDANYRIESVIDIDVNPGIELATNSRDRVIDVTAVNRDATDILDGMDLKNTDLKVALNAIIGSMVQKGYVTDEMSSILVTVKNRDSGKADTLRAEIVKDIDAALLSQGINAPVINQTVNDDGDIEAFAKKHGISFGKAVFIKNIAGKDKSLDADNLAKLTISQLTQIVIDNKIDISDIADYDHDDSIWENIEDSIEETDEDKKEQQLIDNPELISKEQAEQIALDDAGVKREDARFDKTDIDRDDGIIKYEIEFFANDTEYDYSIDASDGTIVGSKKDHGDNYIPPVDSDSKPTGLITKEKAKQIALDDVGATEADVRGFTIELDVDDGVLKYEYDD